MLWPRSPISAIAELLFASGAHLFNRRRNRIYLGPGPYVTVLAVQSAVLAVRLHGLYADCILYANDRILLGHTIDRFGVSRRLIYGEYGRRLLN